MRGLSAKFPSEVATTPVRMPETKIPYFKAALEERGRSADTSFACSVASRVIALLPILTSMLMAVHAESASASKIVREARERCGITHKSPLVVSRDDGRV